ncbi:MAG TPA: NADP-dependent succinic semialdehyde dehydrogenase [Terrimesophilobacter sp.]|nr:NADP-dependent succinic semialdehyde dehydrogenase [Terrimesophilobacter sp.]HRP99424.1 NADP-dependent succinic semialdehyde dehydrogenase [Terrimesophilobacter sp.]
MAITTTNPATGVTEAEFEPHDAAEIERRLAEADAAARALRGTDFATRAAWMHATADLLDSEAEEVARLLTIEMGKPIAQSRAEVHKCVKNMRFYADRAEEFLADEALDDPSRVGASKAWTRYEPLGVVLAVMPWNYPLWQVIRFAAPALMAGNAGVLKHASNVPQSALYLDTLFERGGFPTGSFRTLLIGSAAVADIIADRRVKAVTLTGSEPAGRSVAATAGEHIKKTVLELGGSDPFIVLPSADVTRAAETAVTARVNNNGQSCIAGKRFIVHTDVYDEFVEAFSDRMGALVVGDPLEEATEVGPLATASGRDELADLVDDAVAKGATVRVGGSAVDGPGWFYAPTVLEGITESMRLYAEEAFGPVATVHRVRDLDEAVAVANSTTFGLSSSLWTNDAAEEKLVTASLDAGAVFINGMTVSYPELPFGGIKDSGYGRELAASGIREFCNLKTVWKA